ncbi:YbhB/YbcL family Raf kinase inhibitor-like protein [Derxia gummosa]|uniref:YbhB/YbcL family Raf kinase inhibitor-like protein n=1 Tax=Derxia gummosa DSM 723 TaxID=1121388 RepID=A0A8B6X1U1_9BURK|nr:YbhB/YbcL family Raf kinase inhibitor-like protein [Derxia gummosa]
MKLWSDSFTDQSPIPGEFAFAVASPTSHVALSANRNPHFAWSDLPDGTQSLVLICHDSDVPTKPDDVNQEGRFVPADLPRADFTHWALIDLPAASGPIAAGEFSHAVTPRGKGGPAIARADGTLLRHGINDYTGWFHGDPDMSGDYFGYDGPCPPWNDTIVHHYHFTLYALSVAQVELPATLAPRFTRADVLAAIDGKVLGTASMTGTYSLNPAVPA